MSMYNYSNQNVKIQLTGELNTYSYDPKMKDYVINMIMQILNFPKKTKQARYFQQTIEQNKIIMVWYPMSIPYMNKNYDIPLKIYIPKTVPYDPPRIIINLKQGFSFNNENRDINQNNGEILTPALRNWNLYSDINNALNEIFISFSRVFPIYKPEYSYPEFNNNSYINNYNNNDYNCNNLNTSNSYNISSGSRTQNSNFQPNQNQNNNVYNSCQNFDSNNNILKNENTFNANNTQKNNQNQNQYQNNNKQQNDNNKIYKGEPTSKEVKDEKIKTEINLEEKKETKKVEEKKEENIYSKNEYEKKITELQTKLAEAEKLNEILLKKLDSEIKIKEEKEKIILDKEKLINEYKEKTIALEEKLKALIERNNSINKSIKDIEIDEKPFAINFISLDQKIHYPISCKSSDLISRLEEELYNEYKEFREYNTFLTVNGNIVKRFKTIGENKIKKGDAILVNVYDE